jgi:hypothetical protein
MLKRRRVGMRVGIRSGLATGEVRRALLLAVVPGAVVILGGIVVFGQRSTGITLQASFYTAIDLHPRGFIGSRAFGISSGQ